jgi:hypothetical protein
MVRGIRLLLGGGALESELNSLAIAAGNLTELHQISCFAAICARCERCPLKLSDLEGSGSGAPEHFLAAIAAS